MAVTLQCARCMHEQKIDDDKLETGVPCKICHCLIKPAGKSKTKLSGEKNQKQKDEGIKSGPPSAKSEKQTTVSKKTKPPIADDDDEKPKSKANKRKDDDEDERPTPKKRKDKEEGSSSLIFILAGGGALVLLFLLCAGGGVGAYFMFGSDDKQPIAQNNNPIVENLAPNPVNPFPNPNPNPPFNPNPINPFPNPNQNPVNPFPNPPINQNPPVNPFQQPEQLDPNDPTKIDRVVMLLKGQQNERGTAYTWLKAANPEHARRNEVATILEGQVNDYIANPPTFGNDGMFDAFFRWATKNNVPTLANVVDKTRVTVWDNRYRHDAMRTLGKLKDPRGADALTNRLSNFFDADVANQALTEMGSAAEGSVVKQFNARDGRDRARNLLKAYNTNPDVIMTQCVIDVQSNDNDRRNNAMQWFANAPVDPKRRAEVAKALNQRIPMANFFFEKDLAKALESWGTSENVPALIQRLNSPQGDRDAIRILGKLKDVNGMKAVARAMGNFFMEGDCKAALKEFGPQSEAFVVEAMFMAKDNRARSGYVRYLGESGTLQIGGAALNQLAFQQQQDRGFVLQIQQAFKQIQGRGR